jgi:hypothetical protein
MTAEEPEEESERGSEEDVLGLADALRLKSEIGSCSSSSSLSEGERFSNSDDDDEEDGDDATVGPVLSCCVQHELCNTGAQHTRLHLSVLAGADRDH